MKKLLLMRHSKPEKCDFPTELIPLSVEGKEKLADVKKKIKDYGISKCYCSNYLRAKETAEGLFDDVHIVADIHERVIGTGCDDFWNKQYSDYYFKTEKGESLNEVKLRMKKAIDNIVASTSENEHVLVVSHATAICSYLLNYCELQVIDKDCKFRKITLEDKVILNGRIGNTDFFELDFEGNELVDILFHPNDVL